MNCGHTIPLTSTTWIVADINNGTDTSFPGDLMQLLVGDTIYFVMMEVLDMSYGHTMPLTIRHGEWLTSIVGQETVLWTIHATSRWRRYMFSANDGNTGIELWAHDTSNHSTWRVADINNGAGSSFPGQHMELLVSNTIYFSAMIQALIWEP